MKYYYFNFDGAKFRASLDHRRKTVVVEIDDGATWMPSFGVPQFAILSVLNLAKIDPDVARLGE